jgi:hypothetical protein
LVYKIRIRMTVGFWGSLNWLAHKLLDPPPPRPGAPQPNPVNICEKGQTALFWEAGPNPYYNGNAGVKDWTDFKANFIGSAQEFVETRILGCFLKNDEFGLGDCHALGLEQQVAEILVAAAPSK